MDKPKRGSVLLPPSLQQEYHPTKNTTPVSKVSFGSGVKRWWQCALGHEWEERPNTRTTMLTSCPYCSGKRVSESNSVASKFPNLAAEWHPRNQQKATEVSFGSHTPVWWVCGKCAYEWEVAPNNRTNHGGRGCPACAGFVVTKDNSLATVAPQLRAEWSPKNTKTFNETCYGHDDKVWWVCASGHEWEAVPRGRIRGSRCPLCASHTKLEIGFEVLLGAERWNKYVFPTRSVLPYRPDVRLSDTVFANCDGLYWHSQRERQYHLKMREDFVGRELRLLQFYEDEVKDRPQIVKSMVDAVLGRTKNRTYARKCVVVEVSEPAGAIFLDANHMIGRCWQSRYLGLELQGSLVQVMAIRMTGTAMEIVRSAGLLGSIIVGGFQRLLAGAIDRWRPTTVTTLADLRYADGHSLVESGFRLDGINLGYQYTDGNTRKDKRSFRVPAGTNEEAEANRFGWYRLYDAGKARFVLDLQQQTEVE